MITAPELLRPAVLLVLRAQEGHGYELMRRLAELGVEVPPTPGGLYRALRAMADEGLTAAYWAHPGSGPPRRVYASTKPASASWRSSMASLARLACALERMGAGGEQAIPSGARCRRQGPSTRAEAKL